MPGKPLLSGPARSATRRGWGKVVLCSVGPVVAGALSAVPQIPNVKVRRLKCRKSDNGHPLGFEERL